MPAPENESAHMKTTVARRSYQKVECFHTSRGVSQPLVPSFVYFIQTRYHRIPAMRSCCGDDYAARTRRIRAQTYTTQAQSVKCNIGIGNISSVKTGKQSTAILLTATDSISTRRKKLLFRQLCQPFQLLDAPVDFGPTGCNCTLHVLKSLLHLLS